MNNQTTTQRIIANDALSSIASVLPHHFPARKLLLVCDDNTWTAAGEKIHALLAAENTLTTYSLGRYVHATLAAAQILSETARAHDGLIAIGSGTVNDMTKYAASIAGKPYICVPTAASMNGYTSITASLEDEGIKQSYPATTPRAVIADTSIIAAAPKRMARAGLGDTLCRSTVEADMLLSHLLLDTPYPRHLFDRMRAHEGDLIASAMSVRDGSTGFIHKLMEALLDAGDAMTEHNSSAVASQGEHMIAHTLEMLYGAELRNQLHGEMIALTTLTMGQLQQKMLLSQSNVKPLPRDDKQFVLHFGKKNGPGLAQRYAKKAITAEQANTINARLEKQRPEMKAALLAIMANPNNTERAFMQAGLAIRPKDIGLSDERYRFACSNAYLTRDRFTFLDLAAMNDKRLV